MSYYKVKKQNAPKTSVRKMVWKTKLEQQDKHTKKVICHFTWAGPYLRKVLCFKTLIMYLPSLNSARLNSSTVTFLLTPDLWQVTISILVNRLHPYGAELPNCKSFPSMLHFVKNFLGLPGTFSVFKIWNLLWCYKHC